METLAYALADTFIGLMASEQFQQKVMDMEVMEFRECLAQRLLPTLLAHPSTRRHKKPTKLAVGDSAAPAYLSLLPPDLALNPAIPAADSSTITDAVARRLLENAPVNVKAAYGKAIRNNHTPAAALALALQLYNENQENTHASQVGSDVATDAPATGGVVLADSGCDRGGQSAANNGGAGEAPGGNAADDSRADPTLKEAWPDYESASQVAEYPADDVAGDQAGAKSPRKTSGRPRSRGACA